MFSHGFVGLGFLLVAMVVLTLSTARARTPTAMWAHICIVIALTQVPYYGLLPQIRPGGSRCRHLLARETIPSSPRSSSSEG